MSVAEILEESGLKAPSLYHHFRDKEGLYVAWACWVLEGMEESVRNSSDLSVLINVLTANDKPDLLQVFRDVRLLTRAHSREAIISRIESSLLAPMVEVLKKVGYPAATRAKALTFVHASSAVHPLYRKTIRMDISPDDVARLFLAHGTRD